MSHKISTWSTRWYPYPNSISSSSNMNNPWAILPVQPHARAPARTHFRRINHPKSFSSSFLSSKNAASSWKEPTTRTGTWLIDFLLPLSLINLNIESSFKRRFIISVWVKMTFFMYPWLEKESFFQLCACVSLVILYLRLGYLHIYHILFG